MRRIELLIYPDIQLLDATGPAQVFATAGQLAGTPYDLALVAHRTDPVRSSAGISLVPHITMEQCSGELDTLMIAGGPGTRAAMIDEHVLAWARRRSERARRTTSVCSGSFILAAAGLLHGKRATTHWSCRHELAQRFPELDIAEDDPVFVQDGDVWTSAGVTAGMDLALALVEDDLGHDIALRAARQLVLYLKRGGSQAQFSEPLQRQYVDRQPIRDVQRFIHEHPTAKLTNAALAEVAAMSERNFCRVFRAEVGVTPAAYVESVRVELARCLLSNSEQTIGSIAQAAGFGSAETLHRSFRRHLGTTPATYRQQFATTRTH